MKIKLKIKQGIIIFIIAIISSGNLLLANTLNIKWSVTPSCAANVKSSKFKLSYAFGINSFGNIESKSFKIIGGKINQPTTSLNIDKERIPDKFLLSQNYPNPFNPSTVIQFEIPVNVDVQLKIFNILGQEIRTIVNNSLPAGSYSVVWDGTNDTGNFAGNGVYILMIKGESNSGIVFKDVKRMMLVK